MNVRQKINVLIIAMLFLFTLPVVTLGAKSEKEKDPFAIPNHVLLISKENTYPNTTEDQEIIEPSKLTKSLFEELNIPIENLDLIKLLNESSVNPSPLAIGYRGNIYLGRWPLNYKSEDTTINWDYQFVNENELNNVGGEISQEISYNQEKEQEAKGALTSKVENTDNIKKMMLIKAQNKTKLPLSFHTVVGANTKKENYYNVPIEKVGYLQAHVPAVNERGQITYGEVYLRLKGSQKSIVIKNVTKQGVGAWIPIQDHLSFSFKLK